GGGGVPPYQNRRAMPSEAHQSIQCRLKPRHSHHSSSFPRKRESRTSNFQITFEYCRYPKVWIPACAGMTV
ncbi:hypothetical protein, partial [Neisseria blantyrii]